MTNWNFPPITHIKREPYSIKSYSKPLQLFGRPIYIPLISELNYLSWNLIKNVDSKYMFENGGHVRSWNSVENGKYNSNIALVRDDGKLLSDIDTQEISPINSRFAKIENGFLQGFTYDGYLYDQNSA